MPDRTDEVNLLIVDDLPENLLALDALLQAPGIRFIRPNRPSRRLSYCCAMSLPWPFSTCRCRAWMASSWPS